MGFRVIAYQPIDRPLPARTASVIACSAAGAHLILVLEDFPQRRQSMSTLAWLFTGGFAKGYRTQILGLVTAFSAVATWAVGDATLADLVTKAPVIFGGLGLATLGVKVNEAKGARGAGTRGAKAK